jgi:hypothetical protein
MSRRRTELHRGIHGNSLSIEYVTPDLSPADSPIPTPRDGGGDRVSRRMRYDDSDSDSDLSDDEETRDAELYSMRKRYWDTVWSMKTSIDAPPLPPSCLPAHRVTGGNSLNVRRAPGGNGPLWAVVEAIWPDQQLLQEEVRTQRCPFIFSCSGACPTGAT